MKRVLGLAVVGLLAAVTGCKQTQVADQVCTVAKQATAVAAVSVAQTLSCSNVPAVQKTLEGPIDSLALCSGTAAAGLVGDLVCGQVGKLVVSMGLSTLPAEWKCTGGVIGDKAAQAIVDTCKKSITF